MAEGWKQDPSTSPDLHRGCEERMQRQRAEADGRIQKNLELIRKLMDDKRRLTEEVCVCVCVCVCVWMTRECVYVCVVSM